MQKKKIYIKTKQGFPSGLVVKNLPANPGNMDLIPGSGRYPRDGNSNLPQYSCLGNPRGPWQLQATGSQRVGHDFRDWAHTYPQRPNKEIRVTQSHILVWNTQASPSHQKALGRHLHLIKGTYLFSLHTCDIHWKKEIPTFSKKTLRPR